MIHEKIYLRKNREDVYMTTYILDQSSEFLQDLKRPTVVICPGGAYMMISEQEGEPVALTFNSLGYNAVVVNYSTYSEGRGGLPNPADMHRNENSIFPNPMLDIKAAMETLIENADKWHIDPEQLILCGFSAGGHNCAMYSVYYKEYNMPKPFATILGYPLTDYREVYKGNGTKMCNMGINGNEIISESDLDMLSAPLHVTKDTPQMFIWTTATDMMVPCYNSVKMAMALTENNVPVELHMFDRGPHGISVANESSAIINAQVKPHINQWVSLCDNWLKKRIQFEFPDKMPF